MSGNIHDGHRDRMRSRFLQEGPDHFADHELLEMLLYGVFTRRNTNHLAHALLDEFGSLSNLMDADPAEIARVDGIGIGAAVYLSVTHELVRRYQKEKLERKPAITSPRRAAEVSMGILAHCTVEQFYLVCLDSRRRVIQTVKISEGTVTEAAVQPRKVMEAALKHRASGVLLCHNHPGGSTKPSFHDVELTSNLRQLLELVGIEVVDHIIIAENRFFSFMEAGLLKKDK